MKPSSAKAKGQRAAKEAAELAAKAFSSTYHLTPSGLSGSDFTLTSYFPYSPEVKKCERFKTWEFLSQCDKNAADQGLEPLLIFSRNNEKIRCIVDYDHFLELARHYYDNQT